MIEVGAFEAKTNPSALLRKVQNGEEVIICKHGVPTARLSRYKREKKVPVSEAIENIKKERSKNTIGKSTLRELIDEGRE